VNKSVFQVIGACTVGILLLSRAQAAEFIPLGDLPVQVDKLLANDGAAFVRFGQSVAVSGDTAVIGATGASNLGVKTGGAYVFIRTDTSWTQQAELPGADSGPLFGTSVAVSGDTALIGAIFKSVTGGEGAALVFVRYA
jgi:hypothetical protein